MTRDLVEENQHRPVVAHVNYLFFHSTQSFIYFYLSHLRRVRPVCLTRAPESHSVSNEIPAALAGDFYLYGTPPDTRQLSGVLWAGGLALRKALTRLPPRLAEPLLATLHRRVVPRLRPDSCPSRYLGWAETILRWRGVRLIHAYFGPVGWRMLGLKRKLGLPLVVTFLGDDVGPNLAPWWWWLVQSESEVPNWPERLRELLAEGDLFLVEGPFLRQRLLDLGCPPEKIQVQRIALPVHDAPFTPEPKRPHRRVVIMFAGRFCEQKGLLYALEAFRVVRRERPEIEFRLIGDETLTDGCYAARVYGYIRDHRLQGCVRLLGFLNHAEYLWQMRHGDVFLHPSIVDDRGAGEGGAPTTIIEAQALGLPVIATDHCDIPNVTVPGESAVLVRERDSHALADVLRQLVDDPEKREAMGRAGRRHVEQFHNIEQEAPVLEERYLRLIDRASC